MKPDDGTASSGLLSGDIPLNENEVFAMVEQFLLAMGKKILRGALEDTQQYIAQIAQDLVDSGKIEDADKRKAVQSELVHQLQMVGEKQRIKANDDMWQTWQVVANAALTIVDRLITNGLLTVA